MPPASQDDNACSDALRLLCATAERLTAALVVATHDMRVKNYLAAIFTQFLRVKSTDSPINMCASCS